MDTQITLRVDGAAHPLTVDTRTTLLDALRERLRHHQRRRRAATTASAARARCCSTAAG